MDALWDSSYVSAHVESAIMVSTKTTWPGQQLIFRQFAWHFLKLHQLTMRRPGLRERFSLLGNTKLTDHFWTLFLKCFRFNYPYAPQTMFYLDSESDRYQFTELYESHVRDIRKFLIDPEFFVAFPDTYTDIASHMGPSSDINVEDA
ncbi:hypothetical protein N7453_009384 [Penicillium expansum]|nr:hypothetical protein N7453_009384 [Penicillium expansum]